MNQMYITPISSKGSLPDLMPARHGFCSLWISIVLIAQTILASAGNLTLSEAEAEVGKAETETETETETPLDLYKNSEQNFFHAGLIYEAFPPIWNPEGWRQEGLGPLWQKETHPESSLFAIPPLFSRIDHPKVEAIQWDILYPFMTYSRYGQERRWQFLQWINFNTGDTQESIAKRRYNFFPFLFLQRSEDPKYNYTALFPIYGTLQDRLLRKNIRFVLFPIYGESEKKDYKTYNYLYPIFHWRRGPATLGWQFWPLTGWERREIRETEDSWGAKVQEPGYRKFFLFWPLFFNNDLNLGSDNPVRERVFLPFYRVEKSPLRDSYTIPWPLFTYTNDREKEFKEVGTPWPLIVRAWGEGKQTTRVWPFFSRSENANLKSSFYAWPIYKYREGRSETFLSKRTTLLFFLYSNLHETNKAKQTTRRRINVWPFFQWKKTHDGRSKLQILAPLEVFLPENPSIERNYSPLWSIWRSEANSEESSKSHSFLWNLFRYHKEGNERRWSIFFGLLQKRTLKENTQWRWFHFSFKK